MVVELDNFQYRKMRKLMYLDESEGLNTESTQGRRILSLYSSIFLEVVMMMIFLTIFKAAWTFCQWEKVN